MTIESVSIKVGASLGVASAMLQSQATSATSLTPFIVPIVSAVIGAAMAYAMLKTTVQKMEADVRDMRNDIGEVYALLRDSMTKIAHMEGRLTIHHHHKES